jgi:4-amino-4-deoxy-L-arabinose transferase-like glycosyltransferase
MTAIAAEPTAPDLAEPRVERHVRAHRFLGGREGDPIWVRPALLALLSGTALLYLVGLGASGWANSFYSAAVQAGSTSWKAFFFGSFDASNFITVDKPPASLWVMELSARIFGVNSWSILVPQALEGVAAVGLLYATVRRRFGPAAGLIAGVVVATTPVATLMFRFNNPDALLVLLLVAAAYAVTRALESASTRWLVLAGVLVGVGFLTKMMQALIVVPGFGLVYLSYAKASLRRRAGQLVAALAGIVGGSGWWVAAVELTPASARPYVGGSTTNSVLQLAFGYNGFGRLTGNETGSVGGQPGPGGGSMWGATGITRMFGSDFGGQISWLIPAALILGVAGWLALRRRDEDARLGRAHVMLWATWLVVTAAVFSFSKGIIHPYYSVALAPAIGALVGIGAVTLWRQRASLWVRLVLAAALAVTVVWADRLMLRSPSWHPALRAAIVVVGVVAALGLLVPPDRLARRAAVTLATVGLVVGLAAPAAYSLETAATPHDGAIPSAGPAGGAGGPGGFAPFGGPPPPGLGNVPAPFGLLNAGQVTTALASALQTNASSYTWVAATIGAENASGYQLATSLPVMAIGGFNGTDDAPTLAQFEAYVVAGKIHYFIAGGMGGGRGGPRVGGTGSSSAITSWVESTYAPTTIGYDLTAPAGPATSST